MKCKYCGNEIADGKVYCEYCGRPVQMVPDYSPLEDDILPGIVSDDQTKEQSSDSVNEEKKELVDNKKATVRKSPHRSVAAKAVIIIIVILVSVAGILLYYFSPKHQISLGRQRIETDDYAGALSYFLVASNLDSSAALDSEIGTCYFKLQDYQNASSYFHSALKKNSKNYVAYSGLVDIANLGPDYAELANLQKIATTSKQKNLISKYIVPIPEFSQESGDYSDDIALTLECDGDYDIYYTLDGTDPDKTNGILYKGESIEIKDGTTVVTARCMNSNGNFGDVVSNEYTVTYEAPDMPVAVPDGGSYSTPTQIALSCSSKNAVIYYAWDDDNPSVYSTKYTGPIDIPEGQHILSAVAIRNKKLASPIYRGSFSYLPAGQ